MECIKKNDIVVGGKYMFCSENNQYRRESYYAEVIGITKRLVILNIRMKENKFVTCFDTPRSYNVALRLNDYGRRNWLYKPNKAELNAMS